MCHSEERDDEESLRISYIFAIVGLLFFLFQGFFTPLALHAFGDASFRMTRKSADLMYI